MKLTEAIKDYMRGRHFNDADEEAAAYEDAEDWAIGAVTRDALKTLDFGAMLIARNLNRYKVAAPTEAFWTAWKESRDLLRQEGVSVFKAFGEFYVAHYDADFTKATKEEFDAQEHLKDYAYIAELASWAYGYGEDKAGDEIAGCKLVAVADAVVDHYASNPEAVKQETHETVFHRLRKGDMQYYADLMAKENTHA